MARLKTFRERLKANELPPPATYKNADELVAAYETGATEGAIYDPDGVAEWEQMVRDGGGDPDGERIASANGFMESGAGKLILLYEEVYKAAGRRDWLQGNPAQQTGDCVSHGARNALLASLGCQIANGNGSWPSHEIPDDSYVRNSAFCPSPLYWLRGHGGQGWSCGASISKGTSTLAMVAARPWDDPLGMDLSHYSGSVATKWGRSPPPSDICQQLSGHKIIESTRCSGWENVRDFMASGFGIHSCGGEGWSSSRNEHGYASRKGSWSHALVLWGYDDTPWAHEHYNGPLVLVANSWGPGACKGPTAIHGDGKLGNIPVNSWWAKWSDFSRRDMYAISAVHGWPPAKLKDWNLRALI
jgi:hypothetical protein